MCASGFASAEQSQPPDPASLDPHWQFVWSPRYIDSLILRDENTDGDGTCTDADDKRLFYLADANYNVTAVVAFNDQTETWHVAERYLYDPYGRVTILNGDTAVDPDGQSYAEWSADPDGKSDVANTTLYTGRELDLETGLYYYRARYYHPTLGRFSTRDRIGYKGGVNLYEYVSGKPATRSDPFGRAPVIPGVQGECEALVMVSRWGPPGLEPGQWVMRGGVTWRNYILSGKWQWEWMPGGNIRAPFGAGSSYMVPKSSVIWPTEPVVGKFKGLLGQRIFRGGRVVTVREPIITLEAYRIPRDSLPVGDNSGWPKVSEPGGAALVGIWVLMTEVQYLQLGQWDDEIERGQETLGLVANPMIWPFLVVDSGMVYSSNRMGKETEAAIAEHRQWITLYEYAKQHEGAMSEDLRRRARAGMEAELALELMRGGRDAESLLLDWRGTYGPKDIEALYLKYGGR